MPLIPEQFHLDLHPEPNPEAVVLAPNIRFSLLTSRLVRIEYSLQGTFEDRASQVFWFRHQPAPGIEVIQTGSQIEIDTGDLRVVYHKGEPLHPNSLSILVKETGVRWRFGDANTDNLGGTRRTLDMTHGPIPLEMGLIARSGWAVVDDTNSLVFNESGWLEPRSTNTDYIDLYFFGYGHAYQDCLRDFYRVSGSVPLVPRWSFGNWWSRFWEYSQLELSDLMRQFKENQVPLSVCIIDMDWHITKTGNTSTGWTGYTWNRDLFPDPEAFLAYLHEQGLKTALNLHPAEGVHPHEEMYPDMARRMGMDPDSREPVPFNLADPDFTQAYFELLHHPNEARGVDFWWLDWQQGELSQLPGLDPLWWLNHLHAYDLARDHKKRNFVFSRWGGLGNHRYPIGFSGDTHVAWETLAFQPYFTTTAANVGYGYWSHDIGGHMLGIEEGELFTRWVQFGLCSPILRLHSTKNPFHERLPWRYDAQVYHATRQAMQLRHALIPYLYTMAWRNHQGGAALTQPMYYWEPEKEEAYHCPNQYIFGSELIAAPFIRPQDQDTRLARQVVWLPEGDWFDFFSGLHYPGDGWYALYGGLDDIPLFAKAGAIIPLDSQPTFGAVSNPQQVSLHLFPGADNLFTLYEDDGETSAYQNGAYALTPIQLQWGENQQTLRIGPAEGESSLLPVKRRFTLVFHAINEPDRVNVHRNGEIISIEPHYDPSSCSLTLAGIDLRPGGSLEVDLHKPGSSLLALRDRKVENYQKLIRAFRLNTMTKAVLQARLSEVIAKPRLLASFTATIKEAQLRALIEVIAEAGIEVIDSKGEEEIILWNNQENPDFSYQLSVDKMYVWSNPQRFQAEAAPVPRFKVFQPSQDFQEKFWSLRVSYTGLFARTRKSGAKEWVTA